MLEWCVYTDPCGLTCFVFGIFTVLFVNIVTQMLVLEPWLHYSAVGLAHGAAFQFSCLMIFWSYLAAATSDPGSVQRHTSNIADLHAPADDPERVWKPARRLCKKCECIKPPRAHHCSTCGRCINKMDRECVRVCARARPRLLVCARQGRPPPFFAATSHPSAPVRPSRASFPRPLPLGKQLRREWQHEVFFALLVLDIHRL